MALSTEQLTEIRERINTNISKTKEDIKYLVEVTQPIPPENSIGRLSRMDAINNKSVNEAALAQARAKLGALEIALSKIDEADYGLCSVCKDPIPFERLKFRPESRKCVKCAKR